MERLATRERGECIFIPLKITMRKRYKNADEGVVLVAIQIVVDSDLSAKQRRLRVQHTYSPGRLLLLDPARGEEKLRESSGSTTAWWWEGRGLHQGRVRQPPHRPPIY